MMFNELVMHGKLKSYRELVNDIGPAKERMWYKKANAIKILQILKATAKGDKAKKRTRTSIQHIYTMS